VGSLLAGHFFVEKGGGGVFFREIPPMSLMGLVLGGGYLTPFVRF
jgi:hypothetical protein